MAGETVQERAAPERLQPRPCGGVIYNLSWRRESNDLAHICTRRHNEIAAMVVPPGNHPAVRGTRTRKVRDPRTPGF